MVEKIIIMRIEGRTPTEQKKRGRKTEWAKPLRLCVSVIVFFLWADYREKLTDLCHSKKELGLVKAFSVILIKVLCHLGHKES